jgi:hypothetical protein
MNNTSAMVIWVETAYSLVGVYQHFRRMYWWKQSFSKMFLSTYQDTWYHKQPTIWDFTALKVSATTADKAIQNTSVFKEKKCLCHNVNYVHRKIKQHLLVKYWMAYQYIALYLYLHVDKYLYKELIIYSKIFRSFGSSTFAYVVYLGI